MTAVRSAENRVWTARAANTGVSAIIDARGRVTQRTGIFEEGFLVADVPLLEPPEGGTYYSRHGDHFVYACWIAGGLALAVSRGRKGEDRGRKKKEERE
jgi:apolipoprotein N-acyltransferase